MNEHADVIVAQLYGHTHTDTFRVFTGMNHPSLNDLGPGSKYKKAVAFIAPSVTPHVTGTTGTNPGIRKFVYKPNAEHLEDYDQLYLDLKKANKHMETDWTKLYSFRDAYNVPDLSMRSLLQVYDDVKADNDTFQMMWRYNTLDHDTGKIFVSFLAVGKWLLILVRPTLLTETFAQLMWHLAKASSSPALPNIVLTRSPLSISELGFERSQL